jgi:hypothetical protein
MVVSPLMRKPDLIIGPRDNPQTLRWHLITWRGWQLSLHKWLRSDDDRAPHDHKADNISLILNRGFFEVVREFSYVGIATYEGAKTVRIHGDLTYFRRPLVPYFRKAETLHRVALPSDGKPVWSLWLRWPPRRRWGYWCPNGWTDADYYNKSADYYRDGISEVDKGCD